MSYRPLAPVLRRAHCRTDSSPGCTCTGSGVSREGTPYYIILAVVPRRRRRRGSTTRSRTARRTRAACGTRGRCRSAAARGPTPSTRAPSSSTPGHCQSDVATTDSSTTAPGCRRGACRALPRAISRRITRSGPRRCSPRSPACPASSRCSRQMSESSLMNIYRLINRFAAWGLQVSTSKCELITPRRLVARRQNRHKSEKPVFFAHRARTRQAHAVATLPSTRPCCGAVRASYIHQLTQRRLSRADYVSARQYDSTFQTIPLSPCLTTNAMARSYLLPPPGGARKPFVTRPRSAQTSLCGRRM